MEVILTIIVVILTVAVAVLSIYTLFFYKEQRQTKVVCSISIILSVIAIFCSIRIDPFEISDIAAFIGIIAGVMALPTAVVVGWNIFTALDLKKDWKDLERKTTKEISQLKEERIWLKEYVDTTRNYTIGITNLMDGKYGNAVAFLCSAAVKANNIQENKIQNDCLSHIQRTINRHKNNMGNIDYLETIFQSIKDDFNKIEDKRIKDIAEAIEEIISSQEKKTQKQNKQ